MNIEYIEMGKLSPAQTEALNHLRAIVYPPNVLAMLPGSTFSWVSPQWSIFVWNVKELVARVGLVVRDIVANGVTKRIGGIGGVMTHPNKQGQGLASRAMGAAAERFAKDLNVSYALLFCRPQLVEFYKRLGWKPFMGEVFVQQPQGRLEFSANGAMMFDVKEEAPLQGVLDLNGLPW